MTYAARQKQRQGKFMIAGAVKQYLALGDSMSIDDYTGVLGGGAVRQLFDWLGESWQLDDRTLDGCCMDMTPTDGRGDLITLTIGGNDLLRSREKYLEEGLASFAAEHLQLLRSIRKRNPKSLFIVGDIYAPQSPLSPREFDGLAAANAAIQDNCREVGAQLARINAAFVGNESTFLCLEIEPTHAGATTIYRLFQDICARHFMDGHP